MCGKQQKYFKTWNEIRDKMESYFYLIRLNGNVQKLNFSVAVFES